MKVYLAGAIHGLNRQNAGGWRDTAIEILEAQGHEVLNPLRNRLWADPNEQAQFDVSELVDRDLMDVYNSDCLLVEYTHEDRNYTGTTTEMVMAKEWLIPRIVWVGERKNFSPWLIHLSTKRCVTLEEACEYIIEVFK